MNMRFLEQHFYIDAGVTLPATTLHDNVKISPQFEYKLNAISDTMPRNDRKNANTEIHVNCTTFSESELSLLQTSPLNITDDAKVSLKKITEEIGNTNWKRNKRHSSIFSVDCFGNQRKTLNRRSLNMTNFSAKENSRIPISLKALNKQKDNANDMKENEDVKVMTNKNEAQSARLTKLSDIIDDKKDTPVIHHSQHFTSSTSKLSELRINSKHNGASKSKPSNLPILIK